MGGGGGGSRLSCSGILHVRLLRKLVTNREVPGNCCVARTANRFSSQTFICHSLPKTSHVSPFCTKGNETATIAPLVMEEPACRDSFLCGSGGRLCFSPFFTSVVSRGGRGGPLLSTAPRDFEHINSSCDELSEFCLVCVSVCPCVSPSGVMIQGLLCSWQSDTGPLLPVAVVGAPWVLSCSVLSPAWGALALIPVPPFFPTP